MKTLLIKNIGRLQTPQGSEPLRGDAQGVNLKLDNAAVLVEDGVISGVFSGSDAPSAERVLDAKGALVTPGLVDCHTHLVFGGWRQHEIPLKLNGAGYLDILKAGGGILDTVRRTRQASEGELQAKSGSFLDAMLRMGTTTVEAKSGYGLDLDTELKQLNVLRKLNETHPVDIVPTFMGAHAVPPEYSGDPDGYIDMLISDVLPRVRAAGLAEFADVFCEDSVFTAAQSRRLLAAARALGFGLKIHADEIEDIGGAFLAGELGAVSAEHLIATGDAGIDAMAAGGVIAALLPATSLYLGKRYAAARRMIERGVPVAVATDFNPGSCPSFSLQLCMNLAYIGYRMYPEEILTAVTLNAACAVRRGGLAGTIEPNKQADLVIWDAPDFETVCYRFGHNQARTIIKKGEIIE